MRKIRFRVWNKRQSKMIGPFNLHELRTSGHPDSEEDIILQDYNSPYEDFPIMEFTGLEDKNGKEIYEGDILKCWCDANNKYFFYEVRDTGWYYLQWGMVEIGGGQRSLTVGDREVIGNIYENPELL